ncbi:MAG: hypothetical protein GX234_11405 [Clostridiales bacterium]|nr:hypothetical protein [Clostridiales bacterium]
MVTTGADPSRKIMHMQNEVEKAGEQKKEKISILQHIQYNRAMVNEVNTYYRTRQE